MTNTDMSRQSSLLCKQLQEVLSRFDDLPMMRQSPLVYQELLEALESYFSGMPESWLPLLEREYAYMFNKSLDYKSLGVKDIKELVVNMVDKGMVLYFEGRVSKEIHVMSARMVEIRRKVYLKRDVEKLLNRHGGKIAFESFEELYKDQFKFHIEYDLCALTDLDHLCQVLKDILVVEVANPSGAKVIKRVEGGSSKSLWSEGDKGGGSSKSLWSEGDKGGGSSKSLWSEVEKAAAVNLRKRKK